MNKKNLTSQTKSTSKKASISKTNFAAKNTKIDITLKNIDTSGMVLTGFVKVDNKIIKALTNELDFSAAIMYIALLSHRNIVTDECFPTIDVLSREIKCSRSYAGKAIRHLAECEYIHIVSGHGKYASRYFFPCENFYSEESEENIKNKLAEAIKRDNTKNNIFLSPQSNYETAHEPDFESNFETKITASNNSGTLNSQNKKTINDTVKQAKGKIKENNNSIIEDDDDLKNLMY